MDSPLYNAGAQGQLPAADIDLIEQHWAARVEQLEAQFGSNPAAFSEAYALLKAEYILARYGKVVPVATPQAEKGQAQ